MLFRSLQVQQMCAKLNEVLAGIKAGFQLDFEEIKATLTKGMVRERHLAKALVKRLLPKLLPPKSNRYFTKQFLVENH